MKKLLPLLLFCLVACDPDEPSRPVIVDGGSPDGSKTTRPRNNATTRASGVTGSSVSLKDVYAYIDKDCPRTKAAQPSQASVEPYIDSQDQDTLMYIVNYPQGQGWKVLSADSRTPAIIAEGDKGSFDLNGADGAVAAWMSCVATDMKRVRHARDEDLNFSDIEIACNKAFWTGEAPQPKGPGEPPTPGLNEGHWEETVTYVTELVDTIDHLTPHWDQGEPYNEFCPWVTSDMIERAPAGCVAVAGAEVLYYLHKRYGVPVNMVSEGYCNGVIGNYSRWFDNADSDVWDDMSEQWRDTTYIGIPEALMIGYVGEIVEVHFEYMAPFIVDPFTWAYPANLRTQLFPFYGYSCSGGDYNETIVKNSLLDLTPVIITASDQIIPTNGRIHTFVADAYKRTRQHYTHYHYWVWDVIPPATPGEGSIVVEPDPYYTYSYSSPAVTQMKINWGWWSQWSTEELDGIQYPLNEGWFSLTQGWTVQKGASTFDYNHNISMIYGFALSNNN